MIYKNPLNRKGFSLMEVIVAVFVVGLIVLVVNNIPGAVKLITSSQTESKVREVAAKKIEDVRLTGYDNLANGTTAINDPRLLKLPNVSAFTVTSDCPANICPGGELAKEVKVTISWTENNGPKTYQLVTIVGKGGLK